jgi:hypothetical protein
LTSCSRREGNTRPRTGILPATERLREEGDVRRDPPPTSQHGHGVDTIILVWRERPSLELIPATLRVPVIMRCSASGRSGGSKIWCGWDCAGQQPGPHRNAAALSPHDRHRPQRCPGLRQLVTRRTMRQPWLKTRSADRIEPTSPYWCCLTVGLVGLRYRHVRRLCRSNKLR